MYAWRPCDWCTPTLWSWALAFSIAFWGIWLAALGTSYRFIRAQRQWLSLTAALWWAILWTWQYTQLLTAQCQVLNLGNEQKWKNPNHINIYDKHPGKNSRKIMLCNASSSHVIKILKKLKICIPKYLSSHKIQKRIGILNYFSDKENKGKSVFPIQLLKERQIVHYINLN